MKPKIIVTLVTLLLISAGIPLVSSNFSQSTLDYEFGHLRLYGENLDDDFQYITVRIDTSQFCYDLNPSETYETPYVDVCSGILIDYEISWYCGECADNHVVMGSTSILMDEYVSIECNTYLCDENFVTNLDTFERFPTIQSAIDDNDTLPYHTIYAENNIYYEYVVVNKDGIQLLGENKYATVIDGGNKNGAVVKIRTNYTSIKGFTIRNGKVGIAMEDVHNNNITNCRIINNSDGISIWGSYNNIIHNIIQHQTDCGIAFEHDIKYNTENIISENNISYNGVGIRTIMCEGNEISYNEFFKNSGYAVRLLACSGGGSHNIVHHNNFISNNEEMNTSQGYDSYEGNYWFSYIIDSEGNYWSDYNGTDEDGDGIGDIPYEIDGHGDDDYFPLMDPFNHSPNIPTIDIDGTMGENGWYISDVTITFTWDTEEIGAVYYRLDTEEWNLYTEPIVISEDEIHLFCWYYVRSHGNGQVMSQVECMEIKIDQTPPTINLTVEKIGDNTWLITADVFDETSGINRVEFYVNDEFVGEVTEDPYEWEWSGTDGHTVQAVVYDNAGNSAESEVVDNGPVIKIEPIPFPSMIPGPKVYVENTGHTDATDVEWSFKWYGGWILGERLSDKMRDTLGEIPVLSPEGGSVISSLKFGFGDVAIIIRAECAEGSFDEVVIEAKMMGFVLKILG